MSEENVYANEPPENSEWSRAEKSVLVKLQDPEPMLDFAVQQLRNADGGVESLYAGVGYEQLKKCWPFKGRKPKADQMFFDIHSQTVFEFREARILRYNRRNILVSPHYLATGGMVVDFCDPKAAQNLGPVVSVNRAAKGKKLGLITAQLSVSDASYNNS